MNKSSNTTLFLCKAALIASVYIVLGLIFMPISFGPVQCRISEMLTVLPAFTPAAIPGLAIGCLISNILGGAVLFDVIFGSLATLIGAILTYLLCRGLRYNTADDKLSLSFLLRASLPPIISNTIVVPLVLKFAYGLEDAYPFMVLTVCIGEVLSAGVLGAVFIRLISKTKLFKYID